MAGQSGAGFIYYPDAVYKYGVGDVGFRVGEQGLYMRDVLGDDVCPTIKDVGTHSYTMERLLPYEGRTIEKLREAVEVLERHVWFWDPRPQDVVDPLPHLAYVDFRAQTYAPDYAKYLLRLGVRLDWYILPRCRTHGDPTLENLMRDHCDCAVYVDALPPSPTSPPLLASDHGKLLQSLYGYDVEAVTDPLGTLESVLSNPLSDAERVAALYFAAAHYVRLLPYTKCVETRALHLVTLEQILADAYDIACG